MFDELKKYSKQNICPMHMPGHKRNTELLGNDLPYDIDITEIEGFDNLHNPNGLIEEIQLKAQTLFNAKKSFLLVNGSTCGILSAIRSVCSFGDKILVARNCHRSVYNVIELLGLEPVYIMPETDDFFGFYMQVEPKDIMYALENHRNIKAVVITSPTYEGVISNLRGISEITKGYSVPIIVDSAHGAHLSAVCNKAYYQDLSCADIAVLSLHKTLPVLTQCGLLNCNSDLIDINRLKNSLSIFQTSSPSYVLMSSVDKCLSVLEYKGEQLFTHYYKSLDDFYNRAKNLNHLRLFYQNKNFDIGKIIIGTQNTNITGVELGDILRNKYLIETEMSSLNYIIAMTSICDKDSTFVRLLNALIDIDKTLTESDIDKSCLLPMSIPKKKTNPSNVENAKKLTVPLENAEGRVSGEYIYAYPPGIPMIVPGEVFDKDTVSIIQSYIKGKVNVLTSAAPIQNGVVTALLTD